MARLSLIQKQKPGSGNLKPVLRTQAGVRPRLEWDLQEQESRGPDNLGGRNPAGPELGEAHRDADPQQSGPKFFPHYLRG